MRHNTHVKRKLKELKEKATLLSATRDDIQNEVEQKKMMQSDPTTTTTTTTTRYQSVEEWMKGVKMLEDEMKNIERIEKKCYRGCFCPTICASKKLGELVEGLITKVDELQNKLKFECAELQQTKDEREPAPATTRISSDRMLKMVTDSIKDVKVQRIGIWGLAGVGKTTIMQLLNHEPEISGMFDVVMWVKVSQSWTTPKLQKQVALSLALKEGDLPEEEEMAANKLFELLQEKKFLLLLDDAWDKVDLNSVGIPNPSTENGCKVVLNTRELDVCHKMNTNEDIKIEVLSNEEAWDFFRAEVGEKVMSPTFKSTAEKIVLNCDGLPLALKIASGALKMAEDVNAWMSFLMEMETRTCAKETQENSLLKLLKISYDRLKDKNIKKCFLYCGLYPDNHEIKKSELIRYWKAEGFLGMAGTLSEARVRGGDILESLINASLLERCESNEHVKLHDVIRDLVLTMTSPEGGEECKFLVKAGLIPDEDNLDWENARRVSFINLDIGNILPRQPVCPNLLTLLLQSNNSLAYLSDNVFLRMPSLKVLDLSNTGIKRLPSSISNLSHLRALLLKGCTSLKSLPRQVSGLKLLEVLIATECKMHDFPHEICDLTNLKCLKFDFYCNRRMMISSWEISNLSQMEELAFLEWGAPVCLPSEDDYVSSTVIKQISGLKKLTSLKFCFPRISDLLEFVENSRSWQEGRLKKFEFDVGEVGYRSSRFVHKKWKRKLMYGGSEGVGFTIAASTVALEVLRRLEYFALKNDGVLEILSELKARNLFGLKGCHISNCKELKFVVDSVGVEADAFPELEYLELINLQKLQGIVSVQELGMKKYSPGKNFTSLRELRLINCPNVKTLFSERWIQQLFSLEILWVYDCDEIEEIVPSPAHPKDEEMQNNNNNDDDDDDEEECGRGLLLPKLREMNLSFLPKFVNLFHGYSLQWPELRFLRITRCPKLRRLPLTIDNTPSILRIEGEIEWWEALEWEEHAAAAIKSRFQSLLVFHFFSEMN